MKHPFLFISFGAYCEKETLGLCDSTRKWINTTIWSLLNRREKLLIKSKTHKLGIVYYRIVNQNRTILLSKMLFVKYDSCYKQKVHVFKIWFLKSWISSGQNYFFRCNIPKDLKTEYFFWGFLRETGSISQCYIVWRRDN